MIWKKIVRWPGKEPVKLELVRVDGSTRGCIGHGHNFWFSQYLRLEAVRGTIAAKMREDLKT